MRYHHSSATHAHKSQYIQCFVYAFFFTQHIQIHIPLISYYFSARETSNWYDHCSHKNYLYFIYFIFVYLIIDNCLKTSMCVAIRKSKNQIRIRKKELLFSLILFFQYNLPHYLFDSSHVDLSFALIIQTGFCCPLGISHPK